MVDELTSENFEDFVKEGVVLIDFFAEWCMPCKMMAPIVDAVAGKFKGKVEIGKVDVGEYQQLAMKYNVSSIPNFTLFKDGKVVEQFVGAMSEDDLVGKIGKYL